jgi:hypothetical protein
MRIEEMSTAEFRPAYARCPSRSGPRRGGCASSKPGAGWYERSGRRKARVVMSAEEAHKPKLAAQKGVA